MRRIIRLGDSTSHGGKVVSATSHMTVGGLPVARLGDKCTCPKRGHNNCVIVEGDTNWTIDGIPVALEGHKLSCGGVLISSMPNSGRDEAGGGAASQGASPANLSSAGALALAPPSDAMLFNEIFQLVDEESGEPLPNYEYAVVRANGEVEHGMTDENGHTHLLASTVESEEVEIYA